MSGAVTDEDATRTLESLSVEALACARRQRLGFALIMVDELGGIRIATNLSDEQRAAVFLKLIADAPDSRTYQHVPKTGTG